MTVIRPPITGDSVLDSWTNQITQALNSGAIASFAGGTAQVGGTGTDGASGFNTATIYLYTRTTTDATPLAMNEETTYTYSTAVLVNGTSHDGTSNGLGPNDIWFRNVPSGSGGYLWVTTVHVADLAATEVIGSGSWSAVTKLAEKGDQGKFAVEIYKRVSSAPSAPTDVTWTYSTGALTGTNSASWALSVPAGNDQVWISSVIFDPSTAATTITTWTTPYQGGTTGAAGAAGTNNATVAIYQKNTSASSAPANPSGTFTYTFSTAVLSGGTLNSWSQTLPDLAKGEYLWMKHATASSTTATDTIPTSEFSAAAITGAAGIDGSSVAVVELFKVNASNSSAPADPTGTFTYTFATNILSGGDLDGWAQNRPTVPAGQYLWAIQASAVANATTDSIPASEFSAAVVVSGTGSAGLDSKAVKLTSSKYAIVYDENGLNPSPSSITLTATASNVTNGFFKFTGEEMTDETSFSDGTGALEDTQSVTVPASFADWTNPSFFRVGVSEADQNELAFDRITIPAVQQGSDAYTVILTNDSHTLPSSSAGVVSSYTGSGTTITVYKGATQLVGIASGTPSASQFSVAVSNNSNITEGSKSAASNNIIIADHSGMSNSVDTVKIDYTITVRPVSTNIDFLKSQSLSKSKIGATGAASTEAGPPGASVTGPTGQRQTTGLVYRTVTDSSIPTSPTNANSEYSFTYNKFSTNGTNVTLPTGWSQNPPEIDTNDNDPYYQCTFTATEATNGGTVTETFGGAVKVITFDGIVKFTNSGNTLSSTVGGTTTLLVPPKMFRQPGIPTAVSVGDLWIDTDNDNKLYASSIVGASAIVTTGDGWYLSQDATAAGALGTAANTLALTKARVFRDSYVSGVSGSIPTSISIGDVWINTGTNQGNKMYIAAATGSNQIVANEWVLSQDSASASAAATAANDVAVSKAKVFRQDGEPDSSSGRLAGDIWIDTDSVVPSGSSNPGTNTYEMHIYDATTSAWIREDFAKLINSRTTTIDGGKITAASISSAHIDADKIDASKLTLNSELTIENNAGIKSGKSSASDSSIGVFLGTDNSGNFAFVTSSGTADSSSAVTISSAQTILKNPVIQTGTAVANAAETRTDTSGSSPDVITNLPSYEDASSSTNPWQKLTVSAVGGGGGGAAGQGGSGTAGTTTLVNIVRTVTGSTGSTAAAARTRAENAMAEVQVATINLSAAGGAGGSGSSGSYSAGAAIGTATLGLGAGGGGGAGFGGTMNEFFGGGGGTAGSSDTVIIDIKNLKELAWAAAGLETGVTAPTSADPSGDNLPTITFTINTTQIGGGGSGGSGTRNGTAGGSGGMGYVTESGVLAQLNLDSLSGVSAQNSLIQLSADGGSNPDFTLDQASAETINFKGGTGITTAGTGSSGTPANTITINLDNVSIANGGTGSTSVSGARTNLGLGTISTLSSISNSNWSGTGLSIANGGTGASTADAVRDALDIQVIIEPENSGTPTATEFTNANAIFVVQY